MAGENGGLLSISFAHQEFIPLSIALVFTFLGSLSADLFWYFVTVTTISPYFNRWFKKPKNVKKNNDNKQFFELANKRPYLILIFIKFLVGVRLVLTIYIVAKHKIPFVKYLLCNVVANILFVGVLFTFVWTMSESLGLAGGGDNSLFRVVTIIFFITLIGNLVMRLFHKIIIKLLERRYKLTNK